MLNSTSLNTLEEAYRDNPRQDKKDYIIPAIWTPTHVQHRLVEAYEVLRVTPMRIKPKAGGNGWPQYVYEDEDRKGQEVIERPPQPTLDQITRCDESLLWCSSYLFDQPIHADALQLWASTTASKVSLKQILQRRSWDVDRKIEDRSEQAINSVLHKRRKSADNDAKQARDREVAGSRVATWAAVRLAKATTNDQRDRIKDNAKIRLERLMTTINCDTETKKSVPGKVYTRAALDKYRKEAADIISDALNRGRVKVR